MLQFAVAYSYLTPVWPKVFALMQISALVLGNPAAPRIDNCAASEDTFALWHGSSFHKLEESCQSCTLAMMQFLP